MIEGLRRDTLPEVTETIRRTPGDGYPYILPPDSRESGGFAAYDQPGSISVWVLFFVSTMLSASFMRVSSSTSAVMRN